MFRLVRLREHSRGKCVTWRETRNRLSCPRSWCTVPTFNSNKCVATPAITHDCMLDCHPVSWVCMRQQVPDLTTEAWSLYKCATLWRAVYGLSATKRPLGTIREEKGIYSRLYGLLSCAIWRKLLKATLPPPPLQMKVYVVLIIQQRGPLASFLTCFPWMSVQPGTGRRLVDWCRN